MSTNPSPASANPWKQFFLPAMLVVILASVASGTTYHGAPGGNDGGPGDGEASTYVDGADSLICRNNPTTVMNCLKLITVP